MTTALRPFEPADYPALVAAANASRPDHPESVEEVRYRDGSLDRTRFFEQRIVAIEDGVLVGAVTVGHRPNRFNPNKYWFDLFVRPASRRRGHGSALYDAAVAALRARDALAASGAVKESMTDGLAFLQQRGWVEVKRDRESRLRVAGFDHDGFAQAHERMEREGIRITTFAAEQQRDADLERKAHGLVSDVRRDMPGSEPSTQQTFEDWRRQWTLSPTFIADGTFVAIDRDGRWLGVSNLERSLTDPTFLFQGITGVRREGRGRGVAMALKLRTIEYAQQIGVDHIRTTNDQSNRAMISINEALGFVPEPARIELQKQFSLG